MSLRARGVDPATVDDVVQETALRALLSDLEFDDTAELLRWATVVARNLAVDGFRRGSFVSTNEVPDVPSADDVERTVEQRHRLGLLGIAFARLPASDRQLLRAAHLERSALSPQERNRFAVRLHRARAQLMAAMQSLGTAIAWLAGRRGRRPPKVAFVALPAAVLVVALAIQRMPHIRNLAPDRNQATATRAARTSSSRHSSPLVAKAPSTTRRGITTTSARKSIVRITIPRGSGQPDIGAGVRPMEPTDSLLCLDTIVAGYRCIPVPPLLAPKPSETSVP